jgi:helicase
LPHEVRSQIEDAVKKQDLVTVTATTTLAEGIDLPFRFTILADWLTWDSAQKQRPIGSLLFRNIAGRCGRAGVMTEGDTIIFDNPVGDPLHTDPFRRADTQIDLYVNPMSGNLPSAIASAIVGTDDYEACMAELSSQFLAAVPENPEEDDLVSAFSANLYSAMEPTITNRVRNHLVATRASILDNSREALAVAASPMKLTSFGKAALGTSFSPDSCRAVLEYLRRDEPEITPAELGHHLLTSLGSLPENFYTKFRKILAGRKNNQFPVRIEDLPTIIKMWLAGEPLDTMFLSLPILKRSTKKPKIAVWAAGIEDPTKWDDEFEKFCDVVKEVLRCYIPWLMFACKQLSEIAEGWSERVPWEKFSEYFEMGADSIWATRLLRTDAPVERRAAARVGRQIPEAWMSDLDPLGLSGLKRKQDRRELFEVMIESSIEKAEGEETETCEELQRLKEVVLRRAGVAEEIPV